MEKPFDSLTGLQYLNNGVLDSAIKVVNSKKDDLIESVCKHVLGKDKLTTEDAKLFTIVYTGHQDQFNLLYRDTNLGIGYMDYLPSADKWEPRGIPNAWVFKPTDFKE